VVQPETLLRWHRAGFKALWRWRSWPGPTLRIAAETVAPIRSMARENLLLGCGEDSRRIAQARDQSQQAHGAEVHARCATASAWRAAQWSTFLRNHACDVWACDFWQAYDLFFRPIFTLVFIKLARNVVFAATTRIAVTGMGRAAASQPDPPLGVAPKFLIRDRDDKFGTALDALALATGIRVIRTAVRAPNMNAICEHFLGSLRRECLDHILVNSSTGLRISPSGRAYAASS
jgi:hypothetical protein